MKFSTPIGATFGNRVQWRSPAVVWMTAVGSAVAAAAELAGSRTGGFVVVAGGGVEAACAAPRRDVEIIRTSVCIKVRMDAPVGCFRNHRLYDSRSRLVGGAPVAPLYLLACISRLTRSASRKTRSRLPPRILRMSSALYPRSSRACVIFGKSAAESMPSGVAQ